MKLAVLKRERSIKIVFVIYSNILFEYVQIFYANIEKDVK